jgi:hypothetical protein
MAITTNALDFSAKTVLAAGESSGIGKLPAMDK